MSNEGDSVDDLKVPKSPGVPLPRVPFEIRFLDYRGDPIASMKCTLDWRAEKLPGVTDGDGVVKFTVPSFASTRTLSGTLHAELFAGQAPLDFEVVMELQMPPADTVAGSKLRLANLGYLATAKGTGSPFGPEVSRALDGFRFAQRVVDPKTLVPLGPAVPPLDPATKDRLEKVHDTRAKFYDP